MLFDPSPIDFDRQAIVFVHIPKTAGVSLFRALAAGLGADRCAQTRMEKIDKIHDGARARLFWSAGHGFRNALRRFGGTDPLIPRGFPPSRLDDIFVLAGHFSLNHEPKIARKPVYITLVRDPVERFISHYYFLQDLHELEPATRRDTQPARKYDLERYVDLLENRRLVGVTNVQCRYIGGDETFDSARHALDEQVFLAAPSERLGDFLKLLALALPFEPVITPRENVGQARRAALAPSERTLEQIRGLVAEDRKLFDYVSREFEAVYRRYAPVAALAGGMKPG